MGISLDVPARLKIRPGDSPGADNWRAREQSRTKGWRAPSGERLGRAGESLRSFVPGQQIGLKKFAIFKRKDGFFWLKMHF